MQIVDSELEVRLKILSPETFPELEDELKGHESQFGLVNKQGTLGRRSAVTWHQ